MTGDRRRGPALPDNLVTRDGELYYWPNFMTKSEAAESFQQLLTDLDWHEEAITIAGRRVTVPRLVCWYGDAGAVYRYSGADHTPKPWTPCLYRIKAKVEDGCHEGFNSVLGNLYRHGSDSMGWHADKEKVLGRNPAIASVSLGAERLFRIRHNGTGETFELRLGDGSLLLMQGSLQHHWRHCIPKSREAVGPRINLTFRKVCIAERG